MNARYYLLTRSQKAGLVVLLLACLAFAGWGRSQNVQDTLSIPTAPRAAEFLISTDRMLAWQSCRDLAGDRPQVPFKWMSLSHSRSRFGAFDHPDLKWEWKCSGIRKGTMQSEHTNGSRITLYVISYWHVIAPLTLLALWLLWPGQRPTEPQRLATTEDEN